MTVGKEISLVGTDFKIKDVESLLKLKGRELRDAAFKTMAEDWKVELYNGEQFWSARCQYASEALERRLAKLG